MESSRTAVFASRSACARLVSTLPPDYKVGHITINYVQLYSYQRLRGKVMQSVCWVRVSLDLRTINFEHNDVRRSRYTVDHLDPYYVKFVRQEFKVKGHIRKCLFFG